MVKNPEKLEKIRLLNSLKETDTVAAAKRLAEIMISDARERNDTDGHCNVLRNQGEIRALQRFIDYISNPLPGS